MKIVSVNVAPWSSIVGQCITMMDAKGSVVATLNVHPAGALSGDAIKKQARRAAERVAEAFDALTEKEAVEGLEEVEIFET